MIQNYTGSRCKKGPQTCEPLTLVENAGREPVAEMSRTFRKLNCGIKTFEVSLLPMYESGYHARGGNQTH